MVEPTGHGWSKPREIVRFSLCYGIFFVWAICFISLYISVRSPSFWRLSATQLDLCATCRRSRGSS